MTTPTLYRSDLALVAPTPDDAPNWAEAQDEECARWFDWPGRPTTERCRAYLTEVAEDDDPDTLVWAIRTRGQLAGGIDLKVQEGEWAVSYFVHPALRGRGIARQALAVVVDWAREERDVRTISTRVHVDNLASRRVLEAIGFQRAATEHDPAAGHDNHIYRWTAPRHARPLVGGHPST